MNRVEAEEYAKQMTYRDAVCNALSGKFIPYRKATLIKLYELLDLVDTIHQPIEDAFGVANEAIKSTQSNASNVLNALDCVSKQAVIKAVDKHTFDTDEGLCLDDDISCILEEIPSAQPEPQWIPCSERPPEVENNVAKRVIVTTSWNMVCEAHYCVDHWEMNDIDYKLSSVIAWMPLPEPYKEVRDEYSN